MSDKPKRRLTVRQKKFVAAKVAGKTNVEAYKQAGYDAKNRAIAESNASRLTRNESIQAAIDAALSAHEATPEFAVGVLKQVADQETEIGARRLAAKDILELHGWRKDQRPQMSLNIKQAFFTEARNKRNQPIEGELAEDA